jgi:hypothetical protein
MPTESGPSPTAKTGLRSFFAMAKVVVMAWQTGTKPMTRNLASALLVCVLAASCSRPIPPPKQAKEEPPKVSTVLTASPLAVALKPNPEPDFAAVRDRLVETEKACTDSAEALAEKWNHAIDTGGSVESGEIAWIKEDASLIEAAKRGTRDSQGGMKAVAASRPGEVRGIMMDWYAAQVAFCGIATEPVGHTLMSYREAVRREKEVARGAQARLEVLLKTAETKPQEAGPAWAPTETEYARKQREWKQLQVEKEQAETASAKMLAGAEERTASEQQAREKDVREALRPDRRAELKLWASTRFEPAARELEGAIQSVTEIGQGELSCANLSAAVVNARRMGTAPDTTVALHLGEALKEVGMAAYTCELGDAPATTAKLKSALARLAGIRSRIASFQ